MGQTPPIKLGFRFFLVNSEAANSFVYMSFDIEAENLDDKFDEGFPRIMLRVTIVITTYLPRCFPSVLNETCFEIKIKRAQHERQTLERRRF